MNTNKNGNGKAVTNKDNAMNRSKSNAANHKENKMKTTKNNDEIKGNPRDPSLKKVETVTEVVRKAQEGTGVNKDVKVLHTFDDTFGIPIVYSYGDFELYRNLVKSLFKGNMQPERSAVGLSIRGPAAENIGDFMIILVWINNKTPLRKTVPVMVHEIVHVAQDISDHAGVNDKSGELQAYTVGREYTRVMREFYGIEMDDTNTPIQQSVKDAVSKTLADMGDGITKVG